MPIVDLDAMCTGKAVYGIDAQMPGMVYTSIERSPVLGGTLKSFNDQEARQVRGVQQTVVIEAARPPYGFQAWVASRSLPTTPGRRCRAAKS